MIANANPDKAAGDCLGKEGHVTPAFQLVPRQPNSVQFFRQGHRLGLGRNFFFPDLGKMRGNKEKSRDISKLKKGVLSKCMSAI